MSLRVAFVVLVTTFACRDDSRPRSSPIETAIARDLTARFALPIRVTCTMSAPLPLRCEATVIDGTKLPIELTSDGKDFAWRIAGLVVDTARLVTRIDSELADLAIAQHASCGTRVQLVRAGDRIGCTLSGGGMAFVRIASDGTTSLELALDAASAAARGEVVTPMRERELFEMSHALEALEGESDGEEAVVRDGGVGSP